MAKTTNSAQRRARLPQRYYHAADFLARVFRWRHINARRGEKWRLTFRVRALAKLAGVPLGADARGTYLDALAALQARGELDSPEAQKHTDALAQAAEKIEKWHDPDRRINRLAASTAARAAAPPVTAADFDADPWEELRDEFERFLDELEPDGKGGE